jgi:DNA (cytosine-5)-methyltransferase 1
LFFEAVRVVRQLRPSIVVLENVAALLTRGLDRVLGTLAAIGYDAEWHCIPAAAVGAPHIRDRVFVLAYRKGDGWCPAYQGQGFRVGLPQRRRMAARAVVRWMGP